ncbi:MAG: hypothetical protein Q8L51_00425 [Candidatus Amesbacteria bacterium]|nr:hypothetical protein [Candidatus Amesbacteria bacterium]
MWEAKVAEFIRWTGEISPAYFAILCSLTSVALLGIGSAAAVGLKAFSDSYGSIYSKSKW